MTPLALYVHWPFCGSKCPYCDFYSKAVREVDEDAWIAAYLRELSFYKNLLPDRTLTSVYFGGGTPSRLSPKGLGALLARIRFLWPLAPDAEITIEANPVTAEASKFTAFRDLGVGRLSLGVQAMDEAGLRFLGRTHDLAEAARALTLAAEIFPRFSFDLIYGRADQTPASFARELDAALAFSPRHLSVYQLTISPGTVFGAREGKGERLRSSDDDVAEMDALLADKLGRAGLAAYEVSNFAVPGQEGQHNMAYWHYQDYIGIGPAAHGRFVVEGVRVATENHADAALWRDSVASQDRGITHEYPLAGLDARREAGLMGLRLAEGLSAARWRALFNEELTAFWPDDKLRKLESEGLIQRDATGFRATPEGRAKLNPLLVWLTP